MSRRSRTQRKKMSLRGLRNTGHRPKMPISWTWPRGLGSWRNIGYAVSAMGIVGGGLYFFMRDTAPRQAGPLPTIVADLGPQEFKRPPAEHEKLTVSNEDKHFYSEVAKKHERMAPEKEKIAASQPPEVVSVEDFKKPDAPPITKIASSEAERDYDAKGADGLGENRHATQETVEIVDRPLGAPGQEKVKRQRVTDPTLNDHTSVRSQAIEEVSLKDSQNVAAPPSVPSTRGGEAQGTKQVRSQGAPVRGGQRTPLQQVQAEKPNQRGSAGEHAKARYTQSEAQKSVSANAPRRDTKAALERTSSQSASAPFQNAPQTRSVSAQPVAPQASRRARTFALQVGSLASQRDAALELRRVRQKLNTQEKMYKFAVKRVDLGKKLGIRYRIYCTGLDSSAEAQEIKALLSKKGVDSLLVAQYED